MLINAYNSTYASSHVQNTVIPEVVNFFEQSLSVIPAPGPIPIDR